MADRKRDPRVDHAIAALVNLFDSSPRKLFYSTQIETQLERTFYHWITGRALLELAASRRVQRASELVSGNSVNFYAHLRHRYWRRQLRKVAGVLERVFHPEFAHALGLHGEMMFDVALGRSAFRTEARDANEWKGVTWSETQHELDRIVTRDGVAYGVEIKNTQNYIPHQELQIKIRLCRHLGITPLFILRFAPKSYINEVNEAGGFVLLFEHQLYPFGHSELLSAARGTLGLKVDSPRELESGHMRRLIKWHEGKLRALGHSYSG